MNTLKMLTTLAGTAVLLSGALAEAQQRGGRGGPQQRASMMLRAGDADGDNSVTRAEIDELQGEMFVYMDRNGDGFIDNADRSPIHQRMQAMREERRAMADEAGEEMRERRRGRRQGGRGGRGRGGDNRRADTDQDGRVSEAEFMAAIDPLFSRLDSNSDGVISPDELDAAAERRQDRRQWWRD
ncbi:MAG: EF-hand domain-containing protein [Maricaulis sp.]|nr:EF-hand domain-containing protein [Maricaulis sp.]